ncbi:MAG: ATP-binding protein [Mariprofundaceae bacterium]
MIQTILSSSKQWLKDNLFEPEDMVREQIRLTFQNIRHGWLGLFALAAFTIYAMDSSQSISWVWIVALLLIAAVHVAMPQVFVRLDRNGNIQSYHHWGYAMAILSLLASIIISWGVCLAFNPKDLGWGYFLIALVVMPGFGSAVTSGAFIWIHIAWVLGGQTFLGVFLFSTVDEPSISTLGLMILLINIPFMIALGFGYGGIHRRNIALSVRNLDLLEALEEKVLVAERATQDKSRLLAATSHDLRQPLHALDLFLGSLKYQLKEPNNLKLLSHAQSSSRVLSELLNTLLDVSQLDAGAIQAKNKVTSLELLIQECYTEFYPIAKAKGIELNLRVCHQSYVNTDLVLLGRILRNFLSNAIRYTDKGKVLLAVRKRGEYVRIEVWDTGKGIEEQQQAHVFDEFYQIDNPERDREKGLGLGLSIVRRLSDLLAADVGFQSRHDHGSCFYVQLPISEMIPVDQIDQSYCETDLNPLVGLFVLVVDDSPLALEGLRALLLGWKCEVLMGRSYADILMQLEECDYPAPDIMLIDYRLPEGFTGADVAKDICIHFKVDIPVVIISGDMYVDVGKSVEQRGYRWLQKPVNEKELHRLLSEVSIRAG